MFSQLNLLRSCQSYLGRVYTVFFAFAKISPVTFGGGAAMIPHIESEMVRKREWFTSEEVPSIFAIAQSAPGSIAINASIYMGFKVQGIGGAVAAMLGMLLPANLIIILLTYLYLHYQSLPVVDAAFKGIRPAIVGLIIFAAWKIGRMSIKDSFTLLLLILSIVLLFVLEVSAAFLILGGGLAGCFYYRDRIKRSRE
ncbi:chromate transporter [Halobacillus rhizosphaerae]|uniref:chromate transporter n=1 Tax=Halobacillus rhizosphaerae TaxID=3064889 RepID=UPI00398A5AAC